MRSGWSFALYSPSATVLVRRAAAASLRKYVRTYFLVSSSSLHGTPSVVIIRRPRVTRIQRALTAAAAAQVSRAPGLLARAEARGPMSSVDTVMFGKRMARIRRYVSSDLRMLGGLSELKKRTWSSPESPQKSAHSILLGQDKDGKWNASNLQ